MSPQQKPSNKINSISVRATSGAYKKPAPEMRKVWPNTGGD
jgi:hypothetical protein